MRPGQENRSREIKTREIGSVDIEAYKKEIQSHVDRGNFHAAINIAISCLNENRRNDNQAGVDTSLDICKRVIRQLAQEFGSDEYIKRQD